ncbi:MAG TPA: hypothetical protein VFO16_09080, partial [Pseudonocardiaceae bacterium]|nr:hypothetical protein [Pseudonocardiaceae bacterium]
MTTVTPAYRPAHPPSEVSAASASPPEAETRRSTAARSEADLIVIVGAGAGALSLAALLSTRVIPSVNPGGFMVITYVMFLVLYGVL